MRWLTIGSVGWLYPVTEGGRIRRVARHYRVCRMMLTRREQYKPLPGRINTSRGRPINPPFLKPLAKSHSLCAPHWNSISETVNIQRTEAELQAVLSSYIQTLQGFNWSKLIQWDRWKTRAESETAILLGVNFPSTTIRISNFRWVRKQGQCRACFKTVNGISISKLLVAASKQHTECTRSSAIIKQKKDCLSSRESHKSYMTNFLAFYRANNYISASDVYRLFVNPVETSDNFGCQRSTCVKYHVTNGAHNP